MLDLRFYLLTFLWLGAAELQQERLRVGQVGARVEAGKLERGKAGQAAGGHDGDGDDDDDDDADDGVSILGRCNCGWIG